MKKEKIKYLRSTVERNKLVHSTLKILILILSLAFIIDSLI
jgi:hypothetical protein